MINLKAKYIVVSPDIILENASISIEKGVIQDISRQSFSLKAQPMGRRRAPSRRSGKGVTYDLGESIIIPGLVNAHTHLEGPALYGYCKKSLCLKPPQEFTGWAPKVIACRKEMEPDDYARTVEQGYALSAQNGVTALADHTHIKLTFKSHLKSRLRRFLVEEIVALDKTKSQESVLKTKDTLKYAKSYLRKNKDDGLLHIGVAPHSPFSVSPELYKMLFSIACQENILLSTHLSELKEEVEFLKTGKGKIKAYLRKIGRETPNWSHPRLSPVAYFKKLGILKPPSFFIHCNYLSKSDIDLLSNSSSSVVFCPNSHHYFGHRNHPFKELLKAGVNVSLGTDSLGSNSDLSILKEMQFIWENYTGLTPQEIFKMGTINGVKTLRLGKKIGVLKPGYLADLAVFPIKNNSSVKRSNDVIVYLIEQTPKSIFTMVNGSIVYPVRSEHSKTKRDGNNSNPLTSDASNGVYKY